MAETAEAAGETRESASPESETASVALGVQHGYPTWRASEGHVSVHRLLAVAEYGLDAVEERDIHHVNRHPFDNRPGNLVPLPRSEHLSLHQRGDDLPLSCALAQYSQSEVAGILRASGHADVLVSEYRGVPRLGCALALRLAHEDRDAVVGALCGAGLWHLLADEYR